MWNAQVRQGTAHSGAVVGNDGERSVTVVSLPLNQVALSAACWYGADWHCESQFAGGCRWGLRQVDPESWSTFGRWPDPDIAFLFTCRYHVPRWLGGFQGSESCSGTIQCTSAKPMSIVAPMTSSCAIPLPPSLLFVAKETCRPDRHIQDTRLSLTQGLTVTHGFRGLGDADSEVGCTRAHPSRLAACRLWLPTLATWKSTFDCPTNRIQGSVAAMIDSVQLSPRCPCSGFHSRLRPSFHLRKAVPDDHCWDRSTQCRVDVHDRQCTGRLSVQNPGRLEMRRWLDCLTGSKQKGASPNACNQLSG